MNKHLFYILLFFGSGFFSIQKLEAKISVTIEYACFPAENGKGRLFLIVGVDGRSLKGQQLANKKFQSTASFAIVVNDSAKNYFAERVDFQSPEFADTNALGQFFTTTKVIPLPSGKFSLSLVAFDPNSKDTTRERAEIPILMPDTKASGKMSDLVLLNQGFYNPQVPFFTQNSGLYRLSNFYSEMDTTLSLFAECASITKGYPEGLTLVSRLRFLEGESRKSLDLFGKIKRIKSKDLISNKFDINIKDLPSGKYLIIWDIIDSAGKIITRSEKTIVKSNPSVNNEYVANSAPMGGSLEDEISKIDINECRHIVASLRPISTASEQSTIEYLRKKGTDLELRNYLNSFWAKRDKENATKALSDYRNLIAIAEKKYSTQTMPAYQTERGRVLLQYGQPNMIENEFSDRFRKAIQNLNTVPYEIWYYYTLQGAGTIKQNDIIFVFVQENRGNDNYRLLHSTAIGELRNREWRKAVETNATYNYDRLSPNDRYDQNDSKKFR